MAPSVASRKGSLDRLDRLDTPDTGLVALRSRDTRDMVQADPDMGPVVRGKQVGTAPGVERSTRLALYIRETAAVDLSVNPHLRMIFPLEPVSLLAAVVHERPVQAPDPNSLHSRFLLSLRIFAHLSKQYITLSIHVGVKGVVLLVHAC